MPHADRRPWGAALRTPGAVEVAVILIILARSAVWLIWEQAYFDSDQAITGLMAKHLAEGRAWPLIFYGQHYLLAIEAWIVAPFVALMGASVFTVRLPLVIINASIGLLLVRRLQQDAGLSPLAALSASLFFLLPAPIAASRFVEVSGVAIEPFLYVLLLWMLRDRPAWLGLVAGVGIMNREFTAYGLTALWLVEMAGGGFFTRRSLIGKAIVVAEVAAVAALVTALKPHADLLGPGTAGTLGPEVLTGQAGFLASRVCIDASALGGNLAWLFHENLGSLFGWRTGPFSPFFESRLSGGVGWAWGPLGVVALAGLGAIAAKGRPSSDAAPATHGTGVPGGRLPIYLVLVGLQAVAVYAFVTCHVRDPMLVRYTLLGVFVPVGLAASALGSDRHLFRRAALAGTIIATLAAATETWRLAHEYIRHPPSNAYRALASYLEREGIRYGAAPYWTAYRIVFLTDERVLLTAYDKIRVQEYEDIVSRHNDQSVGIFEDAVCADEGAVKVNRWCLLYVDRARGVAK